MNGSALTRNMISSAVCLAFALTMVGTTQAQVTVTYLANAGFMLEGGGQKVLIDALFDEGVDGYARVPNDTKKQMRAAEAPFDDVDLVLITHHHLDHFGPRTITRFMRSNAHATLLCPPQVRDDLQRHIKNHPGIAERIEAVYPKEGESVKGAFGGVEVEVLNLHHGRNLDRPIENLGFIMQLGGLSVLHVGDTEATTEVFAFYKFQERQTDVALLPAWFVSYPHWAKVVYEYIKPTHTMAMHMPLPSASSRFFGQHASYEGRMDALRDLFPDAVLLESSGDSKTFEATRGD